MIRDLEQLAGDPRDDGDGADGLGGAAGPIPDDDRSHGGGPQVELDPGAPPDDSRFSFSSKRQNEKRESGLTLTPVGDLVIEPAEDRDWIIQDLLPTAGFSILAGKPKSGKSTLARSMALAVARGEPVLGRASLAGPVIYVCFEDRRGDVAAHFRAMGASSADQVLVHVGPPLIDTAAAMRQLAVLIREHGAKLAIIDTLLRFVRVADVNDYAKMTAALDPLLSLTRDTGCHVLAVYHARKADAQDGLDVLIGSTAIAGTIDAGLILKRKEDGTRTLSSVQRVGVDLPETVVHMDEANRQVSAAGTVAERVRNEIADSILAVLADRAAWTEPDIRKSVGGNSGAVGAALRELVEAGRVHRSGAGRRGDPYRYSAGAPDESGGASRPPEPDPPSDGPDEHTLAQGADRDWSAPHKGGRDSAAWATER